MTAREAVMALAARAWRGELATAQRAMREAREYYARGWVNLALGRVFWAGVCLGRAREYLRDLPREEAARAWLEIQREQEALEAQAMALGEVPADREPVKVGGTI